MPVSSTPPTLQQETVSAAQGSWRILIGRRDALSYFETDQRGLVSSFIALFVSIAVTLTTTALMHSGASAVSSFSLIFTNLILYTSLVAASWVVLKVLGKADRFVPFLAVDNWLNAFISVILALTTFVGLTGDTVMFAAIIAGLAARINNARIVVGLNVSQIILLMVAQVVGVVVGLGVLGLFLPVPVQ